MGPCELFGYSIYLKKLIGDTNSIGNQNGTYYFKVKVTNNALLTNTRNIEILVDILDAGSTPDVGRVSEGMLTFLSEEYAKSCLSIITSAYCFIHIYSSTTKICIPLVVY